MKENTAWGIKVVKENGKDTQIQVHGNEKEHKSATKLSCDPHVTIKFCMCIKFTSEKVIHLKVLDKPLHNLNIASSNDYNVNHVNVLFQYCVITKH